MVKVNLVSMNTHISSVKAISGQRIASLQQVISSLDQFAIAGSLQGQAYTNAKDFGQDVLRSLAQGLILYSEELSQSASQLGSLYASIVGNESLDESVLRANIASYQASLAHQSYIYNRLMGEDILNFRSLNSLHSAMSITNNSLQKEQEKLDRLLTFNSQSASVFSDLARLRKSITSGFSEVRSSYGQHASLGGFSIPDKMAWKKDLDDRWKERTEAIRSGYDAVVKKVEKGEELTEEDIRVINQYVHENPHLTLAPSIQNALYNFSVNRNIDDMVQKLVDGGKLPIEAYTKFKELVDSDAVSRLSQVMALLPKPLVNSILVSDGFWEILASVEKSGAKGAKAVSLILNGLSKYEALAVKYDKFSVLIDEASSLVQNIASPVRAVATSTLEKFSGISSLEAAVTKGKNLVGNAKFLGKAVKVLGKVGTVMTFAQVGFEGISGGIEEYTESKDVGKAIGQGFWDAVASVGPLEGATIGATIGSAVPVVGTTAGAVVGGIVGGAIQITKWIEPDFFDDPVIGTKNIFNKAGKAIKGATNAVSDVIGGFGKALGFG
ncbi:hypothetical protein [Streptococcus suis]|uniref:Putative phage protein-like protein n=1 Tax=Streptococcus suis TaxID=1307 RepID=A0A0Z8JBN3_STRSU|nr:hypothetical protein [Streptococcus suis]NQG84781.1 hypothetical protein [Streptococcus suis]CYV50829.1 putative phage protein-like protein [Streptococcus suis]